MKHCFSQAHNCDILKLHLDTVKTVSFEDKDLQVAFDTPAGIPRISYYPIVVNRFFRDLADEVGLVVDLLSSSEIAVNA